MKTRTIISLFVIAIFAMFTVSGCIFSPEEKETEKQDETLDAIDQDYGGFTTSDEAPAFGDETLVTEFDDDETETDLLDTEPNLEDTLYMPTINTYFVRIAWGLLAGDSTATEVVNWDGTAQINKGTLALLKKVRFERNDQIIRPRPDRHTIQWTSVTKPHFDGICLAIIDNGDSSIAGELSLTIGAYSKTLTFAELDSINLIEPVGANGHEVSIVSRKKTVVPFAGGFLEGRWARRDSNGGNFHGRWINSMGTRVGHLRGIWGINRLGMKVLYGKWIDANGRFQGLLAGSWGYGADRNSGWMEGRWVNRSLTTAGTFKARWKTASNRSGHGFFHGHWFKRR